MVKTQFNPNAFNGFIEELFNGNAPRFFRDQPAHENWNHIPVNIKETESAFNIEVIAPGITKEDFSIQVNDKTLTISFELKEAEQKEESKWLRKEFKIRSFKRSFTLGDKIEADKIAATYNQGILTLSLPKKETAIATNRSIDIA
jgi:HSP20 family protein